MPDRGVIKNRARARQLRDYSGLLFGNITPTDIDGLIEYHDKGYVIIEIKTKNKELEFGQRLALERLTDDLNRAFKPTICIIANHDIQDTNEDIDVAQTIVSEFRFLSNWQSPKNKITTKEAVRLFLSKLNVNPSN